MLPHGLVLQAHGVRVGVRTDDPSVLEEIRACEVPSGWVEAAGPAEQEFSLREGEGGWHLWRGAEALPRQPDREAAVRTLGNHLHVWIAEHAFPEVFVHAAAVAVEGRVVLVPGRSWSGKTTMALALCAAGGELLSDDFAVIDAAGRVRDYPAPVSRRRGGHPPERIRPEELGWRPGRPPLPVGLVLLTSYRAGADFRPKPCSAGEAALGLFAQAVAARVDPPRVMAALARAVDSALCLEGPRGEAAEAARHIVDRMRY